MGAVGVSRGVIYFIGLAMVLNGNGLVAQEGEGNVVPAGTKSAQSVDAEAVKSPTLTNITPTSLSGDPLQAFGKKKNKLRHSNATAGELDVLPPIPSELQPEKKIGWLAKRRNERTTKPKVQKVKKVKTKKVASSPSKRTAKPAPTESILAAPAETSVPTNVTPTSLSGVPLQAFDKKKNKGRHGDVTSGEFGVLPPIPVELQPKKKKRWLF